MPSCQDNLVPKPHILGGTLGSLHFPTPRCPSSASKPEQQHVSPLLITRHLPGPWAAAWTLPLACRAPEDMAGLATAQADLRQLQMKNVGLPTWIHDLYWPLLGSVTRGLWCPPPAISLMKCGHHITYLWEDECRTLNTQWALGGHFGHVHTQSLSRVRLLWPREL